MLKVYLAAPWARRAEAAEHAKLLEAAFPGTLEITRDWWNHEAGDEEHEKIAQLAQEDFDAVLNADALVLLNFEKSEGKSVEQGIALMNCIPIFALGERGSNIFQWLDDYIWCADLAEVIACLKKL